MKIRCEFCGKYENEIEQLIQSPINDKIHICSDCILSAFELISEDEYEDEDDTLEDEKQIKFNDKILTIEELRTLIQNKVHERL